MNMIDIFLTIALHALLVLGPIAILIALRSEARERVAQEAQRRAAQRGESRTLRV